jgi:hypothetical protein
MFKQRRKFGIQRGTWRVAHRHNLNAPPPAEQATIVRKLLYALGAE